MMQVDQTIVPSAGQYESENYFVLISFSYVPEARQQTTLTGYMGPGWFICVCIKEPVLKIKSFCHPLSKFKDKDGSVVNMMVKVMSCSAM